MKRKIAIFQTDLSMGGIQRSLINLLNSIDYSNYDVDLYLFNKEKFYFNNFPNDVNIVYLSPCNKFMKLIPFQILNKFYKPQINKKYDVSIDFNGYSNETALAMINSNSNKKVMWIHQDLKERKKREFKYRVLYLLSHSKYKFVDQFVFVSKAIKKPFEELQNRKVKYSIIPNIIKSNEILSRSKEKTDIKVNNKNLNLVTVGRLCYQKGFDILIDYMKEIVDSRKDIELYIIGAGPDENKLRKQINKLKLDEHVHLLGGKENPHNIMKTMDAFVLTSRYEGQGMVILEAKVLGLPILITKNIEKYVDGLGIVGTNNFVSDVIKLEKCKSKKVDYLNEYNDNIIKNIYELFDK